MLAVLASWAGCTPSAPCAARNGPYTTKSTERAGGTCGPIKDTVNILTNNQPPDGGCPGSRSISADNCIVSVDVTCTGDGALHLVGETKYLKDSTSAAGVATITGTDSSGATTCSSTYDTKITAGGSVPFECKGNGVASGLRVTGQFGQGTNACCSGWSDADGKCGCKPGADCTDQTQCCATSTSQGPTRVENEFCEVGLQRCSACVLTGQQCSTQEPWRCCSKKCLTGPSSQSFCATCIGATDTQLCSSDAECCGGLFCNTRCSTCREGACKAGEPCCAGGSCPASGVCPVHGLPNGVACTADSQCSSNRCLSGRCCGGVRYPYIQCSECCGDLLCDAQTNHCGSRIGGSCADSFDCAQGRCKNGVCTNCLPAGGLCDSYVDCCGGNICKFGVCTAPPCSGFGAGCASGSTCCSGACTQGSCACLGGGRGCSSGGACCSGICNGICTCSPGLSACTSDSECCFGPCMAGGVCPLSSSSTPSCPAGQYPLSGGGCSARPASCANGAIVCNCPPEHGEWCHLACKFHLNCGGSPNPNYPCP